MLFESTTKKKYIYSSLYFFVGHVFCMGTYIGWPPFLPQWLAGIVLSLALCFLVATIVSALIFTWLSIFGK